jgi:cytidine deaminase
MMTDIELISLAVTARARAYCPYSHFAVGAALECADGTVYTGCNIENAAYPVGLCAERTAAAKAVSDGHRDFVRLAVAGSGADFCTPCGMCRQFLTEFAPALEIFCVNRDGQAKKWKLSDLLPGSFGPKSML